jgi:hypothetical protein
MTDTDLAQRLRRLEQAQAEDDRARELVNQPPQPPPLSPFSKAVSDRQAQRIRERHEAAQREAREREAARETEAERVHAYLESVQPDLDEIDEKIAAADARIVEQQAVLAALQSERYRLRTPPPAAEEAPKPAAGLKAKIGALFGKDLYGGPTNIEHAPFKPATADELADLRIGDPPPLGGQDGWVQGQQVVKSKGRTR